MKKGQAPDLIAFESFRKKADALAGMLEDCVLCPRECRVKRSKGEKGFCGLPRNIILSHAGPHFGEEPPISGTRGAGTLFFASCTLRCPFCQNHQISHFAKGKAFSPAALSKVMLDLRDQGCHNIELVTPTSQIPGILEALLAARQEGMDLPAVYNSGGYEKAAIIRELRGIIDVYLPDFKYGTEENAFLFSCPKDYIRHAIESIREMIEQNGVELDTEDEIAKRGVIIRHLVLPGHLENSRKVLALIRDHLSTSLAVSLMSQYTPTPAVRQHPTLGRRITRQEYEVVVNAALDMGFESLFIQEVDDRTLAPDFDTEAPFQWY
jgi:putative pyruvate formate lyase activating enzyme